MFRFANPEYLYLLIIIPILCLLFIYARILRKKNLKKIGEEGLLKGLMPDVSVKRPIIKFVLLILAFASLILMMARPQMGMKVETNEHRGIEMVVAVDVSNSMIATDVAPNRLEKVKLLVSNIADKMKDDKVALVVFAGQAFIQLPITNDFVSAKMFLDAISPKMVSTQGTNIAEAIKLSLGCFTNQKNVERAIVIITDGEDHEGGAEEMAKEAAKKGVHVYVLGIGSTKGSTIPASDGGVMRDKQGNVVITKLNEQMCSSVAQAGNGVYIHVDNSNIAQDRFYYELNKLEKHDMGSTSFSDYAEQFQLFALFALVLLLLDVLLLEKKNDFVKHFKNFRNNGK